MKKNSFDKVVTKYLKEFLNTPSDNLEYLEKFYTTPQIDMTNYHEWRIFSTLNFGIHYYSFWHNPNNNDFEKIDRKSTRLNSSHSAKSRMPSSA